MTFNKEDLTEHEGEKATEEQKQRELNKNGGRARREKKTQKALTRAPCGVVTQRTSCLWVWRPPDITANQRIGMCHQPVGVE